MTKLLTRRDILASVSLLAASGLARASQRPPVLLELFTSQGCSSCPPANVLAGRLMGRDDVIVVSLNVDYWDYLGWKDTLAQPEFTKRQRDYAKARGDGEIYTPQMVINGESHAVGSRKADVVEKISEAHVPPVALTAELDDHSIRVAVPAMNGPCEATMWVMSVGANVTVDVARGENAGATLTHYNPVRKLTPIGMCKGKGHTFEMMRSAVISPDAKFALAILQKDMNGPVIGLQKIPIVSA